MERHRFSVVVEKDKHGYFAFCPELQGCYTQGTPTKRRWRTFTMRSIFTSRDRKASGEELPQAEQISLTYFDIAV